jgi:hypothetical protein
MTECYLQLKSCKKRDQEISHVQLYCAHPGQTAVTLLLRRIILHFQGNALTALNEATTLEQKEAERGQHFGEARGAKESNVACIRFGRALLQPPPRGTKRIFQRR